MLLIEETITSWVAMHWENEMSREELLATSRYGPGSVLVGFGFMAVYTQ